MPHTVTQRISDFNPATQGYAAFQMGLKLSDNPHEQYDHSSHDWITGWAKAAGEACGEWAAIIKPNWSTEAPGKQGDYWHWSGDPDDAPFILSVLFSGSNGKCFVSSGNSGIEQAIYCDEFGGYWTPAYEPAPPVDTGE